MRNEDTSKEGHSLFFWAGNILMMFTVVIGGVWYWESKTTHASPQDQWTSGTLAVVLLGIGWVSLGLTKWAEIKPPTPRIRLRQQLYELPLSHEARASFLSEYDQTAGLDPLEAQKVFDRASKVANSQPQPGGSEGTL